MSRKKILLVDDSGTVLLMERMILAKDHYDIITATSGEEGVRRAVAEKPDAILMDVIMPGITGIEACRQIRDDASIQATPIIMVTTRSEMQFVQDAFENGCNDFVTKPINADELLAKLRSVLGM